MLKIFGILFNFLIVDLYYFPFSFWFFPAFNLKMGLAAVGIIVAVNELIRQKYHSFGREIVILLLISSMVSLASLFSMSYNHTDDGSYASYLSSAAVWLSGSLVICFFIRKVHGSVTLKLICSYLLAVCVAKSIAAQLIDQNEALADMVTQYTIGYHSGMRGARLYSLGCAVDFAGCRFAAVMCAVITAMAASPEEYSKGERLLNWMGVIIVTVLGSMISRTTFVGTGIGLCFAGLQWCRKPRVTFPVFRPLLILLLISIPIFVYLYNTDYAFRAHLRFGFEGFFSLVEQGSWESRSNDMLVDMLKFPDNMKTWLIGDGYFENALKYNINYFGREYTGGYYMGTDIGYCRFLFYFGFLGLIPMMFMVIYPTIVCCRNDAKNSLVYLSVLVCALAVWWKVASDLFCICALFFCCVLMDNKSDD